MLSMLHLFINCCRHLNFIKNECTLYNDNGGAAACNGVLCVIGDRERHIETKNGPKEGISACLAVTASGHKLDTMFIKAGKTTRCLKKIEPHPHAMWTYSAKGWSTEATMLVWFEKVLLPYTRGRPAVVVMDDYDAHWVGS